MSIVEYNLNYIITEKGKLIEKLGRKTTDLRFLHYDGWVSFTKGADLMEKLNKVFDNELDKEWLKLIYEAKQLGLSSKEIKDFLRQNKAQ